jgi:hypothetical protein
MSMPYEIYLAAQEAMSRYAALPSFQRDTLRARIDKYSVECAALDVEFAARRTALNNTLTVDIGDILAKIFGVTVADSAEQQDCGTVD